MGLELDHGQASGQLHLEIHVLRGSLASETDRDLGLLLACQDSALGSGKRLAGQKKTGTLLGGGGRGPGAAQDGKQGKDEGQVHGFGFFGWRNALWDGVYLCLCLYACVVIRSVRYERIRCLTPRANCRHLNNNEYLRRSLRVLAHTSSRWCALTAWCVEHCARTSEGDVLGLVDGACEGDALRLVEGACVDDALGLVDGACVGVCEGDVLGLVEGTCVGDCKGDALGLVEGICVGDCEDSLHTIQLCNIQILALATNHRTVRSHHEKSRTPPVLNTKAPIPHRPPL